MDIQTQEILKLAEIVTKTSWKRYKANNKLFGLEYDDLFSEACASLVSLYFKQPGKSTAYYSKALKNNLYDVIKTSEKHLIMQNNIVQYNTLTTRTISNYIKAVTTEENVPNSFLQAYQSQPQQQRILAEKIATGYKPTEAERKANWRLLTNIRLKMAGGAS